MPKTAIAAIALTLSFQTASADLNSNRATPIPPAVTLKSKANYYTTRAYKMPCRSGSFRTRVTVTELDGPEISNSTAAVQIFSGNLTYALGLITDDRNIPLAATAYEYSGEHASSFKNVVGSGFRVGEPVWMEVVWTDRQIAFYLNDKKVWSFKANAPTGFMLFGSSGTMVFDHNAVSCDLIS